MNDSCCYFLKEKKKQKLKNKKNLEQEKQTYLERSLQYKWLQDVIKFRIQIPTTLKRQTIKFFFFFLL